MLMKQRRFMHVFIVLMICLFGIAGAQAAAQTVDDSRVPPLLITEIVPDSSNMGGADAFEFIEIYNNTDQVLNFRDFHIIYRYPTGPAEDQIWIPEMRDIPMEPGKAIVFWIANSGNANATADDFNRNYFGENREHDLIEHVNLVRMPGGIANQRMREIIVAANTGEELVSAVYNRGEYDVAVDKGIFYRYPQDGSNQMVKVSGGVNPASPGIVEPDLVPKTPVSLNGEAVPVLVDLTESVQTKDRVEITAQASDEYLVADVTVHYKEPGAEAFKEAKLTRHEDGTYRYVFPFSDIFALSELEYVLTASNGMNQTQTDVKTLELRAAQGGAATPPLLITEIVPDSANYGGADGYEFIEVYNNTNQPLRFGEFKLLYRYPTNTPDQDWFAGLDHITLDPGSTFVLWVENSANGDLTVQDFNQNYGTDLIENKHIVKAPAGGGMANGSERTLVIATKSGEEIVSASYNDGSASDVRPDMGIFYHFPIDDSNQMIKISAGERPATPGSVQPDYVPSEPVALDGSAAPSIIDRTETVQAAPGETISFMAEAHDELFVTSMQLYYRWNEGTNVEQAEMTRDAAGFFKYAVSVPEDLAEGSLQYYFTASNGYNSRESAVQTIEIEIEHVPDKPVLQSPVNGEQLDADEVELQVRVADPQGDLLDVSFYKGQVYDAAQPGKIKAYQHAVDMEPPAVMVPEGEKEFTEEEYELIRAADGSRVVTDAVQQFPYHRFEVELDEKALQQETVEVVWQGSSLAGRKVSLYAWSYLEEQWVEVDAVAADSEETFVLTAEIAVAEYVRGGKLNVLVQDELPARDQYDYTFVWLADTQFYSEVFPELFEAQVNWIRDMKDELNIQYVFHSGDIVNTVNQTYQWEYADRFMGVLDEADIPYGVVAGNHDVYLPEMDYREFYRYFGEDRFAHRPYYGGSYENNRGHYALISSHGNDYVMVHMGWQPDDDGIAWMNEVLARYPDRIAVLNFHQYLDGNGKRTAIANKLFEEVVKPNPNVRMVLGGHHAGNAVLIDELDDDGDGVPDREVYQLLQDFQGHSRGGDGYLKVMNVDASTGTIDVTIYSPARDAYDLYEPYTIHLNISPQVKRTATDYFAVNVYLDEEIGTVHDVESGGTAELTWDHLQGGQTYYWYVKAVNADGGAAVSDIWYFQTAAKQEEIDLHDLAELASAYIEAGEIRGPLQAQVTNSIRQAQHHFENGRVEQALHFLNKLLEHLSNEAMQAHISAEAKAELEAKAAEIYERLQDELDADAAEEAAA